MTIYTDEKTTRPMNTVTRNLFVLFLVVAAVFPGLASAQGSFGRIAYDFCGNDDFSQQSFCGTYLYAGDLASRITIPSGFDPALSPDGTRVALTGSEVLVLNLNDWSLANLHSGWSPAWSPDGTKLAFAWATITSAELYVMNADGSNV